MSALTPSSPGLRHLRAAAPGSSTFTDLASDALNPHNPRIPPPQLSPRSLHSNLQHIMGMCMSTSVEDLEQKKRSQAIDRKLEEDSKRLRRECKILLLGMSVKRHLE